MRSNHSAKECRNPENARASGCFAPRRMHCRARTAEPWNARVSVLAKSRLGTVDAPASGLKVMGHALGQDPTIRRAQLFVMFDLDFTIAAEAAEQSPSD